MGTLLRFLLTLLGVNIRTNARLSEVSKTIDSLRVSKQTKWFWGGLLHFFLVAIVLVLLVLRHSEVRHSEKEIIALLLASLWAWLGPVLIWYYEKVTLLRFAKGCRAIVANGQDSQILRRAIFQRVSDLKFSRYFVPAWILVVCLAFLRAGDFVTGFGVTGCHDILWWFIFLGVAVIAYYTALGFCLSYKTYLLTKIISRARLDHRIFHVDGVFGLSFIGDFAFKTATMFFSGWLFAPLVFFSSNQNSLWHFLYSTPAILLDIFFIFTALSFAVPIYIIHYKILREKSSRSKNIFRIANELSQIPDDPITEDHLKKFDFAKELIVELQAAPNWPLRLDTALKFSFVSIFVPVLAGAITAILKVKVGAQ